eukprot:6173554-Pleurochrysis_carterae.AAC.1
MAHAPHKVRVEGYLGERQAGGLAERAHCGDDRVNVVVIEEVGHLARVEDVIEVLEEGLGHDLRVGEEEDDGLALLPRLEQHALQVVSPFNLAVALGDLDLEAFEVRHGGGEAREALTA